jgi:hypothetical protein
VGDPIAAEAESIAVVFVFSATSEKTTTLPATLLPPPSSVELVKSHDCHGTQLGPDRDGIRTSLTSAFGSTSGTLLISLAVPISIDV